MQKTDHIKCWWERGETGTSFIISRSVKCYNRFGKLLGSFFQSKTYTYLMNWQFHLWLFTQEKQKHVHQKSCKRMYMVALLVVANNWEQSCFCTQQTSTGAWINGSKSIQCIEKEQTIDRGNTLKHLGIIREARCERLSGWFYLGEVLEQTILIYIDGNHDDGYLSWGRGGYWQRARGTFLTW